MSTKPDLITSSHAFNDFYSTPPPESAQDITDHPEKFNGQYEYRFALPYAGYYAFSYAGRGVGHCKVVLRNQGEFIHVLVHEPKDTGTISVTNFIEHIATQIYWGFLRDRDPKRITWTIQYLPEDMKSQHSLWPVQLYWNGYRFSYNADSELGPFVLVPRRRLRDLFFRTSSLERVSRMNRPDSHAPVLSEVIQSPETNPFDHLSVWKEKQEVKHE